MAVPTRLLRNTPAFKAAKILRHAVKGGIAPVMSSAPVVDNGYIGQESRILTDIPGTSSQYAYNDPNITIYSGKLIDGTPNMGWIKTGSSLSSVRGFGFRFATDAEAFEVRTRNTNGYGWRAMVDGQWIQEADFQLWGGLDFFDGTKHINWKVDFGTGNGKPRTIDVFFNEYDANLGGVTVGPSTATTSANNPYRIWKAPIEQEPNVMVFGDSWTVGWESSNCRSSFPYRFGELMGIKRVVASGVGGQGYLATSGNPAERFISRAADLSRFGELDLLVIGPAGLNDNGQTAGDLQAAVTAFASDVIARQPNALIAVFGPQRTAAVNLPTASHDAIRNGWQAATGWNSARMNFFSTFSPHWFDVSTSVGNFTQAMYSSGDNNHLNPRGHNYVARRIADDVTRWLGVLAD